MHFEEFQTLDINGNAPSGTGLITKGRKDVFRLEHNMEAKVYFRFRDFVGRIPLHCHNVVHEDHAMMVLGLIDDVGRQQDAAVAFVCVPAQQDGCAPGNLDSVI